MQSGTVVAGFDASPQSRKAVWWAAFEAASRRQPLLVVQAFSIALEELARIHLPSEAFVLEPLRRAAEQELEELITSCRQRLPELDVRARVRLGHPAKVISDAATGASLLVLGAPGLSRTQRMLLGSTSAELVRKANAPVVVIRGEREAERVTHRPTRFDRLVVGVDGSSTSVRAIGFAYEFADNHDAELVAILAWNELPNDALPPTSGWKLDWEDINNACRRELAESLAGWGEHFPNVVVRQEVTTAQHPTEALFSAAEDADLLVVGTHGRGALQSALLGSVSHAVVHYAACPVAVVR